MTSASLRSRRSIPLVAAALLVPAFAATAQGAQPSVGLGTASSVAVLGGQTVTNTGPSVINGDLGVSSGTAVTGFPPGLVNGAIHAADAVALQAQSDLTTAYNDAAGRTPAALVPGDLGGAFLTPGVYERCWRGAGPSGPGPGPSSARPTIKRIPPPARAPPRAPGWDEQVERGTLEARRR